ncbi:MAG: hypothetical protein HZA22_13365 [Nitrospirae bacterium]|nr:hypothetical protein [Nitrospirota bacterium]
MYIRTYVLKLLIMSATAMAIGGACLPPLGNAEGSGLAGGAAEPAGTVAAVDRVGAVSTEDGSGIHIKSLKLTSAGYMLDLRYEVTDQDKASRLLRHDTSPYLVHDRSGKVLAVPNMAKVGKLQQTNAPPDPGKVYFIIFDSGGKGLVRPGDTVTLILNGAYFEGLTVQ